MPQTQTSLISILSASKYQERLQTSLTQDTIYGTFEIKRSSLNYEEKQNEGEQVEIGNGVFATEDLKTNTNIGFYGGDYAAYVCEKCTNLAKIRRDKKRKKIYAMLMQSSVRCPKCNQHNLQYSGYGHWSSIIQHAYYPFTNVYAQNTDEGIALVTSRPIKSGEELFIDYGDAYWTYQLFGDEYGEYWPDSVKKNLHQEIEKRLGIPTEKGPAMRYWYKTLFQQEYNDQWSPVMKSIVLKTVTAIKID